MEKAKLWLNIPSNVILPARGFSGDTPNILWHWRRAGFPSLKRQGILFI